MNQKLEDLLQLALLTPEEVRAETANLNVGFDKADRSWEVIVKYHGEIEELAEVGISVELLIAGYAILTVPETRFSLLLEAEQIEYVEMPKRFYYGQTDPVSGSCIVQLSGQDLFLTGKGVLVAFLDSGIDYRLPVFRNEDGSTRIAAMWDQTEGSGGKYTREGINGALWDENGNFFHEMDISGHGTAVAGIAVGQSGNYRGIAPEAELLVVKLGVPKKNGFPRTTEIMRGVTWALRQAEEVQKPLVINLSFGNSYGPHDGTSLLERFLDSAAEMGRTVICVGAGNEGASDGHAAGKLSADNQYSDSVELEIGEYERNLSLQIWKDYRDSIEFEIIAPGGERTTLPFRVNGGKYTVKLSQTELLVFIGEPTPYSAKQEIYIEFLPDGRPYIQSGVWTIDLRGRDVVRGRYDMYLPAEAARSSRTGFYRATPVGTLTVPSAASRVITVGAYDSTFDAYADFSGRGEVMPQEGIILMGQKPDIAAPGVNILAPLANAYGGFGNEGWVTGLEPVNLVPVTGTSFATPIVAGAAALLMEWGIVQEHDRFLYGEKIKAFLQKGALPLRGEAFYPNEKTGWGKLCVERSLPM